MTPTARLIVLAFGLGIMASMAFMMFALSGGHMRPGFRSGLTMPEVIYDTPPVTGPRPSAPPASARPRPPAAWEGREPGAPDTTAEDLYYSAIRKRQELTKRLNEHFNLHDALVKFADTPGGKDLKEVSDLARRGRFAEAKPALQRVMSGLADADWRIQDYVLKMAITLYKQDKDTAGLKAALGMYLDAAKKYLESRPAAEAEGENLAGAQQDLEHLVHEVEHVQETLK